ALASRVNVPCAGAFSRTADSGAPSASESFASTPGADTVSGASSLVTNPSFAATGAAVGGTSTVVVVAGAVVVDPVVVAVVVPLVVVPLVVVGAVVVPVARGTNTDR